MMCLESTPPLGQSARSTSAVPSVTAPPRTSPDRQLTCGQCARKSHHVQIGETRGSKSGASQRRRHPRDHQPLRAQHRRHHRHGCGRTRSRRQGTAAPRRTVPTAADPSLRAEHRL